MIWLTGSALGICILMIAGLVVVILVNGLSFFWPKPLEQVTLKDGGVFLGEVTNREAIPDPGQPDHLQKHRIQLRGREPRPVRLRLQVDRRGRDREARGARGRLLRRAPRVRGAARRPGGGEGRRAHAGRRHRGRARGPPRAHREGGARPRGDRDDREARDRRHQLPHREGPPRVAPAGPRRASRARPRPVAGAGRGREDHRRAAGAVRGQDHGARGPHGEGGHDLRHLPDRRGGLEGAALARHLPRLPGERARHGRAGSPSTAAACGSS